VTRILVIDDEPQIVRALRINLRARQYEVVGAGSAGEALDLAARQPPDLVILDLGLPDMDGVDVIGGLRGWTAVPIIVLSGRADSTDKVEALDAGADDYVTKPFGMDELLARMRAAVRRTPAAEAPPRVRLGDLVIDLAAKRVTRQTAEPAVQGAPGAAGVAGLHDEAEVGEGDGRIRSDERSAAGEADPQPEGDIRLTPTEWHLLEVMLRNPGKLLSHRQLLHDVWGPGYDNAGGNLRLYMAQLRRKLEKDPARPRWLITEPGMGYRYQPPDPGEPSTQA
jgi:two-component system, OmpR family, KDP operon response regulator KdpE